MSAQPAETMNGKPRKRSAVKAAGCQADSKVKATIHLSLEASQRLTVHAAMMGLDRSELVEQLIRDHLKRFVVSDRGGASDDSSPETTSSAA
ncbi:MAG: ribbon-helix-helix domain-containing protein [Bdellovibrionota bacterium]